MKEIMNKYYDGLLANLLGSAMILGMVYVCLCIVKQIVKVVQWLI